MADPFGPALIVSSLSYADSNHDKQNQNLLCYHYTIRQSYKCAAKLSFLYKTTKKKNVFLLVFY